MLFSDMLGIVCCSLTYWVLCVVLWHGGCCDLSYYILGVWWHAECCLVDGWVLCVVSDILEIVCCSLAWWVL